MLRMQETTSLEHKITSRNINLHVFSLCCVSGTVGFYIILQNPHVSWEGIHSMGEKAKTRRRVTEPVYTINTWTPAAVTFPWGLTAWELLENTLKFRAKSTPMLSCTTHCIFPRRKVEPILPKAVGFQKSQGFTFMDPCPGVWLQQGLVKNISFSGVVEQEMVV